MNGPLTEFEQGLVAFLRAEGIALPTTQTVAHYAAKSVKYADATLLECQTVADYIFEINRWSFYQLCKARDAVNDRHIIRDTGGFAD